MWAWREGASPSHFILDELAALGHSGCLVVCFGPGQPGWQSRARNGSQPSDSRGPGNHMTTQGVAVKSKSYGGVEILTVSILFIIMNVRWVWLYRHGQPLDIDEAGYLNISLVDLRALKDSGLIGLIRAIETPGIQAPVTPAMSAISYLALGAGALAGFATTISAGVVAIVASYCLGWSLGGRRLGLVAGILVATSPVIIDFARCYNFALPATALTTLALLALARSDRCANASWAVLFGICLGLMPLTRTMTIAFVPALALGALANVMAEPDARGRRLLVLALSLAIAIAMAATWLVPNGLYVFHYLVDFSVGPRSVEFGRQQTLLDFSTWLLTVGILGGDIHLPDLIVIGSGVCVLLFMLLRLIVVGGSSSAGRIVLRSKLLPSALLVAVGLVAVTASRNKGLAFMAPLVPAMLIVSGWSLVRFGQSEGWKLVTTSLIAAVAIASVVPAIDLSLPTARLWVIDLPILGPSVVADGRGTIQKYEAAGGYDSGDPRVPIDALVGKSWTTASATTAQRLRELGATKTMTTFAFRHRLLNVNTVNLQQLLSGGAEFWFTQIVPVLTGSSIAGYSEWLSNGDSAAACFLLTASGDLGEFLPPVNQENIEAAARATGFDPISSWVTARCSCGDAVAAGSRD
jgi:hypothetical protein